MVRIFKNIAILEGISYLVLFANMLLIKPINLGLYKTMLYPIGMTHGLLFIGYVLLAVVLKKSQNWNFISLLVVLTASLLPLATFFVEKKSESSGAEFQSNAKLDFSELWKIKIVLLTCSLIFPYYQGDPTIFNKVLLSQLDNTF